MTRFEDINNSIRKWSDRVTVAFLLIAIAGLLFWLIVGLVS